jgi:hypothetical protein
LVEGALTALETGSDTFAAAGFLPITGTFAVTEQPDVFGVVLVDYVSSGYVNDNYVAQPQGVSGDVLVQGALSVSEAGADTFAATSPTTYSGACYGVGIFGQAIYGSCSVTHRPQSEAMTSAVGAVTVTADANAEPAGVAAIASVGVLSIVADANVSVVGVEATTEIGSVVVLENEVVVVSGLELTTSIGAVVVNTTAFDFEAVKNSFDRNRVVYVEAKTPTIARYVYVEVQPRMVYIEPKPAAIDRKVVVARDVRQVYVSRGTTSKDRTVNI